MDDLSEQSEGSSEDRIVNCPVESILEIGILSVYFLKKKNKNQGWNKMMKAASRQFKRRKMMRRKTSTVIRFKNLSNSKLNLLKTT